MEWFLQNLSGKTQEECTAARLSIVLSLTPLMLLLWPQLLWSAGSMKREPSKAEIVDQCIAGWKGRQRICKSFSYSLVGNVVIPQKYFTRVFELECAAPQFTYKYEQRIEILVDLITGRSKRKMVGETFFLDGDSKCGQFVPEYLELLYDGEQYQQYQPTERRTTKRWAPPQYDPELRLYGANTHNQFFQSMDYPVFFSHGVVPGTAMPIIPQRYLSEIPREVFEDARVSETPAGRYFVLRTIPVLADGKGRYEIWVDPDRQYSIIRWTTFVMDKMTQQLEVQYQDLRGWWLAKSWSHAVYDVPDSPSLQEVRVSDVELDPPIDVGQFRIVPSAGMIVYDASRGKRFVAKDGGELGQELNDYLLERDKPPQAKQRTMLLLVGNLLFLLIIVALLFHSKLRMWLFRR